MQLYLLRHGHAVAAPPAGADADRPLSLRGREDIAAIAKAMKRSGAVLDAILASPYLRARQTAEIVAAAVAAPPSITNTPRLTPEHDPRDAWEEVRTYRDASALLLVSHEPLAGKLAAFLLSAPHIFDVPTGCLFRIDLAGAAVEPRGLLRWMLTPETAA